MKTPVAVHPPLFAVSVPLNLFAANAGIIAFAEIVVPTLIVVACSFLVWGLVHLILRDVQRSASVASVFSIGFLFHTAALALFEKSYSYNNSGLDQTIRFWIWILIWVAIGLAAGWKARYNRNLNLFLNVSASACLALAIFSVGSSLWRQGQVPSNSTIAVQTKGTTNVASRPDVYYLILDGYGRQDALNSLYGFDNGPFLASLEKLGFNVASKARANFCQTQISLASSLNMCGPDALPQPQSHPDWDRMALTKMIDDSRFAQLMREKGYSYLAVTSGFPPLKFEGADHVITGGGKYSLFADALLARTPLRRGVVNMQSQFESRRMDLRAAFKSLGDLAAPSGAPKLCIAHLFAPHPPFVFKANGEARESVTAFGFWDGSHFVAHGGSKEEYRSGYRDQIQYINSLVLQSIGRITEANPNAIVILQGDHGPKSELDQDSIERTNLKEVFPILLAVRGPKKLTDEIYEAITPVNAMRLTAESITGETLPDLPDRSYYSTWEKPLIFTDVTLALDPSPDKAPSANVR